MKPIPENLTRDCPLCGEGITYKTKLSFSISRRKNSVCFRCRPKKISKTLRGLQPRSTVPVVGKYTKKHNNDVSMWMKKYWSNKKNRQHQSKIMTEYYGQAKGNV